MHASITLSEFTFARPDGTPLLSDLTLRFGPERCGLVGRNGTGKTTLLRLIVGDLAPVRGTIRVEGRIVLLRQDVQGAEGDTIADLFGARAALDLLARAEAGRASLDDIARADWTLPDRIGAALSRLGLAVPHDTPLAALSGGQRTRAGLAAQVFAAPDILLLDEPTNNLDRAGRAAVAELLDGWNGGAIVASHDRDLLDRMDAIVELTALGATRYGGNYTAYRARKALELQAAEHDLADAEKRRETLARKAQQAAERKARRDGAGQRKRAKGDQPKILLDAMKERSEGSGGANARLRDARRTEAETALDSARDRIERLRPVAMELAPSGLPSGRTVLQIAQLTGGHDPEAPVIRNLSLTLTGPERLAVTGPNGAGKTTLLALITGAMQALSGKVSLQVPHARLDQSVSLLDPALSLAANFRRLDPGADDNSARAALARFGFRAEAALRPAGGLSGGERLRAGLACTLGRAQPPQLLILDEPTNHLDLDALEALEAAVRGYDGALIVVSHDTYFMEQIGVDRELCLTGSSG